VFHVAQGGAAEHAGECLPVAGGQSCADSLSYTVIYYRVKLQEKDLEFLHPNRGRKKVYEVHTARISLANRSHGTRGGEGGLRQGASIKPDEIEGCSQYLFAKCLVQKLI
jgi:hypothetical protein